MEPGKKLVVFDLDYTLWPLHADEYSPPFSINCSTNTVSDSKGRRCHLYPDTINILKFLKQKNYTLAAASRAKNIYGSYQLLHLFGIADYFTYKEIYSGSKKQHFSVLSAKCGLSFNDMVFFDNDYRNIRDVSSLGVQCILVTGKITLSLVCSSLNLK